MNPKTGAMFNYAKAYAAAITYATGSYALAITDGTVTNLEWVVIGVVTLLGTLAVFLTPNVDVKALKQAALAAQAALPLNRTPATTNVVDVAPGKVYAEGGVVKSDWLPSYPPYTD